MPNFFDTPELKRNFFADAPKPVRPTETTSTQPSGLIRRVVGDSAVDLGKGIIGVGEAAVGAADIVSGGHAGKALESIGYNPVLTRKMLSEGYSPERQAANQKVSDAKGFIGTAKAMLENPSTIAGTAVESAPLMAGGGGIARGLKYGSAAVRAGIGEGVVGGGMAAEQIRQQSDDGLLTRKQTVSAIGSGAGTGLLGVAGGKIAGKLGIADVDTAIAGGAVKAATKEVPDTVAGKLKQLAKQFGQGVISEGVLEELPQSVQEQMWQNYATDRPIMEGVPESAAQGLLAGAAMGGPIAALTGGHGEHTTTTTNRTDTTEPAAANQNGTLSAPIDVSGMQDFPESRGLPPENQQAPAPDFSNVTGDVQSTEADGVPVMVTKKMRADLAGKGFTPEQVSAMNPQQAWEAINAQSGHDHAQSGQPTEVGQAPAAIDAAPAPGAETPAPAVPFPDATPGSLSDALNASAEATQVAAEPAVDPDRERLASVAQASGLDPDQVLALDDSQPGDLTGLPDETLAAYARGIVERAQKGATSATAQESPDTTAQQSQAAAGKTPAEKVQTGQAETGSASDTVPRSDESSSPSEPRQSSATAAPEGSRQSDSGQSSATPLQANQGEPEAAQPALGASQQAVASTKSGEATAASAAQSQDQTSAASVPSAQDTPAASTLQGIEAAKAAMPTPKGWTAQANLGGFDVLNEKGEKVANLTAKSPEQAIRDAAFSVQTAAVQASTPESEAGQGSQGGVIQTAAAEAATSPTNERALPTDAQKEAGNYKKGHAKIGGLDISIENPAGTKRNEAWPPLANHYGYIKGTVGKDKDHVDVFMTEKAEDTSLPVFVVDQKVAGRFDEHKVVLGAATEAEARKAYYANYSKDFHQNDANQKVTQGAAGITKMTHAEFEAWVRDPNQSTKPAASRQVPPAGPVTQVIGRIAEGAHPAEAMRGVDDTTARALAKALGHKIKNGAKAGEIANSLSDLPRPDLVRTADRAYEASATPKEKAEREASRPQRQKDANDKLRRREQEADLRRKEKAGVIATVGGQPFKTEAAARAELNKLPETGDFAGENFGVAKQGDGFVLRRFDGMGSGALTGGWVGPDIQRAEAARASQRQAFMAERGLVSDKFGNMVTPEEAKHTDEAFDDDGDPRPGFDENGKRIKQAKTKEARSTVPKKPVHLLEAISRMGGLNREAFREQGVDPAAFTQQVGIRYVFRKKGGMTLDRLREMMQQEGYLARDPEDGKPTVTDNDAMDLLDRALRGDDVYSANESQDVAEYLAAKRQADEEYEAEMRASPAFDDAFDAKTGEADNADYTKSYAELTEDAYALGATAEDIIDASFDADPSAFLQNVITRLTNENDVQSGAEDGNRGGSTEPGQETQPEQGRGSESLALEAGTSGQESRSQEVAPQAGGLFAAPTAKETIDAARKAKSAERDGLGRDLVKPESGDGELLAGEKPQQLDVEAVANDAPATTEKTSVDQATQPFAEQEDLHKRLRDGEATLNEYKAGWAALQANRDAVIEHLTSMRKADLLKIAGSRYNSDNKPEVVRGAMMRLEDRYAISGSISYGMSSNMEDSRVAAIAKQVSNATDADLAAYAKEVADARESFSKRVEGSKDPKTLEDFGIASRLVGGEANLTPEQRATFDALRTEARRERREADAKRNATIRQVDTGTTGMTLVETKHTQKGHDLFVIRMDDRVERDVYNSLNIAAKRLGGHYSSYRGNGAIPGFTFTTRAAAEQFMGVRDGSVDASAQQDEKAAAKTEARAETLADKAAVVRERAEEKLNAERKDNTRRRAAQAASAEADARRDIATAATMANIAKEIEAGRAKLLANVNARTQVDLLESTLRAGHWENLRDHGVDWEKAKATPIGESAITNATLPKLYLTRGDAAVVARRLQNARGGKAMGVSLAKEVDYGDEYGKAVQDSPHKFVLVKKRADGTGTPGFAFFATKKAAQAAITATQSQAERRGLTEPQHVVVKMPRAGKTSNPGQDWAVAMSPELAIERKLWSPDFDKKVNLNPEAAQKIIDVLGVSANGDQQVPYWWHEHLNQRKQFARMGIETNYEMREALREYLPLREVPGGEDRVRKLERALVGDKSVGVDFFPTPPAVVSRLIEQADIGPGMRVLEPSAGKGDIAEAVRNASDDVTVDTVEMSAALREILEAKGFDTVGHDFMAFTPEAGYDRIVMNPPFNNDSGAAHVQHAYEMLNPGGRLVAVMGNGQRGKAEFDAWLEKVGGLAETLPDGSFKSSFRPTGVSTQVVVIDKPSSTFAALTQETSPKAGQFSRRDPAQQDGKGKRAVEVRTAIAAITEKWGENEPQVVVVDTAQDLPESVRAEKGWQDVEGWYDGQGAVYLVAGNLTSDERRVLAHEAVGHYGIEAITGEKEWAEITALVKRMVDAGHYPELFTELRRRYPGASESTFVKEAVAVMAEKGLGRGVVTRVIAATRRFLRSLGFNLDFNERELRDMIGKADRFLHADSVKGQASEDASTSFAARPDRDFSAQVPVVGVAGGTFGDTANDLPKARRAAQAYLRRLRDSGRVMKNADTGWEIKLSAGSIRELVQFDSTKLNLMAALPRITNVAVLADSASPQKKADGTHDTIKAFHTFYAPIALNGEPRIARLVVREDANGTFAYDLQQTAVLNEESPAFAGLSGSAGIPRIVGGAKPVITVGQLRDAVNAIKRPGWAFSQADTEKLADQSKVAPLESSEYGQRQDTKPNIDNTDDMRSIAREFSQADGMADSDRLGLRKAVNEVLGGYPPVDVTYLRGEEGLDGIAKPGYVKRLQDQRKSRTSKSRTAGLYLRASETVTGKPRVVLFTDVANTPTKATFTAAHEIAGHHGIRSLLGKKLDTMLARANQNPTVKAVADAIYSGRGIDVRVRKNEITPLQGRLLAIEEALADLAAANRTGRYEEIQTRHGVDVPLTQQQGLKATIARVIETIKSIFSTNNVRFTDAQVHSLLEASWKAAQDQATSFTSLNADGSLEQVVFHGTPHTVDKFSLNKIGTGEGAQAFGWGAYFASSKDIADHYRKGLTERDFINQARDAYDEFDSPDDAIEALREIPNLSSAQVELLDALQVDGWLGFDYPHQAISAALRQPQNFDLSPEIEAALKKQGNLYRVDVPEDSDLLDWDKPLSEQPAKVRAALRGSWLGKGLQDTNKGREIYEKAVLSFGPSATQDYARQASEFLNSIGIPGLRYLDGTSRSKVEGSANYVIWDEAAISEPRSALESTEDQTQSEAFRNWFGESEVIADGQPMVVYHGSQESFDTFAEKDGIAGWFSEDTSRANAYADNAYRAKPDSASQIYPAYLSIQSPAQFSFDMNDPITAVYADARDLGIAEPEKLWPAPAPGVQREAWRAVRSPQFLAALKENGFDGIRVREKGAWTWAAFTPNQIKSATANSGNFDPASDSILESVDNGDVQPRGIFGKATTYADKFATKTKQPLPKGLNEAQRAAAEKFVTFKPGLPIKDRIATIKANIGDRIAQKVIDQFRPLKTLNIKAFMQAHLSKGTDGALEASFEHGIPELKDGAFIVNERSGGFKKVLSDLNGEHDKFLMWVVGNRAEGLLADGRERLFTADDIAAMKSLNQGSMDNGKSRKEAYGHAVKELERYNRAMLDIAQQAGLVDAEARKVWEDGFYIPFYREMEGDNAVSVGQVKGLVKQKIIERLVGGTDPMGDPLENILANWSHMLTASMRNMAANHALDSAVDMKIATKLGESEKEAVWTMREGKEVYWRVADPAVLEALNSLTFTGYDNPLMRAAGHFKRALTTGVTVSPSFRIRNVMRDLLSSMATSNVGYNPMRNVMDGMKATRHGSDTDVALLAGGGKIRFGAINDGNQAGHAKRLITMGVDEKNILDTADKFKNAIRRWYDTWQELGDRSETINRAVLYDRLRAEGKDHLTASYEARDLMNFTSMGSAASIRAMAQVLPFFNARLQGIDRLIRGAKADPRRFMAVAGSLAMASALLFLLNSDDDDYKKLPDYVRDNYWTIKLGGTWLYIPKPFEIGAMASIVERGTELAVSGDDYQAKDFGNTLASLLTSQLAMNPIPQIARPVLESAFNYDLFRMAPIDTMGQQNLSPEDRYTARTSAGAVAAGSLTGVSPQRVEHMVTGYFGWLGIQALNVSDYMLRDVMELGSNPRRDLSRASNVFVMGDFLKDVGGSSSKYVTRFYAVQAEIDELYASANFARSTGDAERYQDIAANPTLQLRSLYAAGNKQMAAINRNIKAVSNDRTLSSSEKNDKIEDLTRLRDSLAERVDQAARGRTISAPATDSAVRDRINRLDDEEN